MQLRVIKSELREGESDVLGIARIEIRICHNSDFITRNYEIMQSWEKKSELWDARAKQDSDGAITPSSPALAPPLPSQPKDKTGQPPNLTEFCENNEYEDTTL